MQIVVAKNYEHLSRLAADYVQSQVLSNPCTCLGTVTGGSPEGMYQELARRCREEGLDISGIHTINTDEYVGLSPEHPQSYRYYLTEYLHKACGVPQENIAAPSGCAADLSEECLRYEEFCRSNTVDLQILGVGHTGHIAFNEPEDYFPDGTHVIELAEATIEANAKYFSSRDEIPKQAITVGIGTLMQAKKILFLVSGKGKAEIVYKLLCEEISPLIPASVLRLHRNVLAIIDEDAISVVREKAPEILR